MRNYLQTNLQGDVVGIYNDSGTKIYEYAYDAWGNIIKSVQVATGGNAAHAVNPFRYRGYYYDTETGFYYLQSRYYNPEWGRFLNADVYVNANGNLLGYNMFAYCSNNPVMNVDPTGEWSWHAFGEAMMIGACVVGVAVIFTAAAVMTAGASATIIGAAAIGGLTSAALSSASIGAEKEDGEHVSAEDVINVTTDSILGTASGAIGGIKVDSAVAKGFQHQQNMHSFLFYRY